MAVALGARADRLAYVFAGGYLAALRALVPQESPRTMAALCATESGGAQPSAIETTFADGRITGDKTFVTLGCHAEVLFVLAKEGHDVGGRPRLALARVESNAPGVVVTALPGLPFVPEIGHARVRLDGAPAERLEGDGWGDYVRPFRTIEDVHVHLAYVAWQLASSRRWGGDPAAFERGLGIVCSLRDLSLEDPSAPSTHLALAGVIAATEAYADAVDWSLAPAADRARWERDRALLRVASKVRERRRARAWDRIRGSGEAPAPR